MRPFTIRPACATDAGALADLWVTARRARRETAGTASGPVDPGDEGSIEAARSEVDERLADDGCVAVLAEDDQGTAAMSVAVPARADDGASPDLLPGLLHISMVAVRPDRWGGGLGEVVLSVVQDEARRHGFTAAQLWTQDSNARGRRLYERMGWKPSGRTKVDEGEAIGHYERVL